MGGKGKGGEESGREERNKGLSHLPKPPSSASHREEHHVWPQGRAIAFNLTNSEMAIVVFAHTLLFRMDGPMERDGRSDTE